MAGPLFGGTQKSSTIMVYKPLMAGPRLYSDETALVKDGGGFAMALPVAAREDTTEPWDECDTLPMGTAGLGANKIREQGQCPPLSIFDLLQPGAAHQLVIALISLPKKNFAG
jgi:hypothetical protein